MTCMVERVRLSNEKSLGDLPNDTAFGGTSAVVSEKIESEKQFFLSPGPLCQHCDNDIYSDKVVFPINTMQISSIGP